MAVLSHREFGSRKLLEDLNAMEHNASFSSQLRNKYVQSKVSGYGLGPESDDHNEWLPDCKRTTRAMATKLLSPKAD